MINLLKVLPFSPSTYPSRANLWYLGVEVLWWLAWHQPELRSKNPCAHTPLRKYCLPQPCALQVSEYSNPELLIWVYNHACGVAKIGLTIFHTYTGGVKVSFGSSRNGHSWGGRKKLNDRKGKCLRRVLCVWLYLRVSSFQCGFFTAAESSSSAESPGWLKLKSNSFRWAGFDFRARARLLQPVSPMWHPDSLQWQSNLFTA